MEKIRIEALCKTYGNNKVLKDINLDFVGPKIYGIVGRNGSGKTLIMKAMLGFLKADEGRVVYPYGVVGEDFDFPNNVGFIIEHPGFLGSYTGFKNLKMLAEIKGIIGDERIKESMDLVGLDPESNKKVSSYSMGMKQKLAIAQAIMEEDKVLILDEPMNGLDNDSVLKIRHLLLNLKNEGRLIILASHNQEDIDALCDEVIRIDKGSIIEKTSV